MDNLVEIKKFVKEESLKDTSKESCGLCLKRGSTTIAVPCLNVSPKPGAHFIISPLDIMELSKTGKVVGFYHSHIEDEKFTLSEYDRLVREKLNLDSLIYSIQHDKFIYYHPNQHKPKYLGRPFIIGLYDCINLVQDYYKYSLNIKIPDPIESVQKIYKIKEEGIPCPTLLKPYYDKWDFSDPEEFNNIIKLRYDPTSFYKIKEKIKNRFWVKEHFLANGFKNVNNINDVKKSDVILLDLSVDGKLPPYPSHCGIFVENNEIIHHPLGATSRRAIYGKLYKDRTSNILRHKDMI